ncbi:MAG TPA: SRPBCC domain-containing protein [Solirubrobacteraceae bacterium]
MSRKFEITREIDLPAAPREVWTAITADTAAWQFPTGMEIPAGTMPSEDAPVTTWDPPKRLVIRIDSPDGTFNALDYSIEARAGGTAHLRYVHSGILADEWEDQYDAIDGHTDFYLHTLAEYLQHFKGRPATYVGQPSAGIEGPEGAGAPDAMDTLRSALGIGRDAAAGDAVHAQLGDAGALDGVIDYATPEFLGVRTEDSLYRFFGRNHFGGVVGMSAHVFRDGADAVGAEAALKRWLDSVYAS